MARLTLETLDRRDLMSASVFAGGITPPIAHYQQLELENTLVSNYSAAPQPGRPGDVAPQGIIAVLIGL